VKKLVWHKRWTRGFVFGWKVWGFLSGMLCVEPPDEDSMVTRDIAYPVQFCNFQLNSLSPCTTECKGKLLWSKSNTEIFKNNFEFARSLLLSRGHLAMKGQSELRFLDKTGKTMDWYALGDSPDLSPVILGAVAFVYFRNSILMNMKEYGGRVILDSKFMPGREHWSHALQVIPRTRDALMVNQFTGGPMKKPKRFEVRLQPYAAFEPIWSYDGDGTLSSVMLADDEKRVLIVEGGNLRWLEMETGKTHLAFDAELAKVLQASLDQKDNILLLGLDEAGWSKLLVFSKEGRLLWEAEVPSARTNQPPACGIDGKVYLFVGDGVSAYVGGMETWHHSVYGNGMPWITVTTDNKIIVLTNKFLYCLSESGEELFAELITTEDEKFYTPAVVDESGKIYVAGTKKLYCYQ
jgi:outer membrane protein assembly factor BamB